MTHRPTGVLLLQLGTPDSTSTRDVRRYLREFLSDPRVLDIPVVARRALLELVILPFRPRRSAHAYRQIWTDRGSPLLTLSHDLVDALSQRLGPAYRVALGMRYQNPPIAAAVTDLLDAGCERLVLIPLFPQYSSAATGSAVERALAEIGQRVNIPGITVAPPFYDHPGFVTAQAALAAPVIDEYRPDHVLFSYHGLPEKQVRSSDTTGAWCLASEDCSSAMTADNRYCYRAQGHATTRAIAGNLGLQPGAFSTAFQSRLAGQKWIEPYTDRVIVDFAARGIRRLAVLTPSFTTDCLETLEEIGIRLRNQWADLGGEALALVPCVNTHPLWVDGLAEMVESAGIRA